MKFRRPFTFESLESKQLLNAAPLDSTQLEEKESLGTDEQPKSADGWIRLQNSSIVYESDGESQVLTTKWPLESLRDNWQPLKVADFNGDGSEDILGVTPTGDPWMQIRDAKNPSELVTVPWGDRLMPSHEVLGYGDVNNDSLLDVISLDRASRELWVSVNRTDSSTSGGFARQNWGTLPTGQNELFVGDFNGDSKSDVLIGTATEKWELAQSNGASFEIKPWGGFPALDWQDVLAGHFDASAGIDIAALAPDNTWWVWSGTDTGMQPAKYWGHLKMVTDDWLDQQVADLNADGLDDIIGRTSAGELWVSTAKGEGKFHPWRWADGWIESAQWQNVVVADVYGDSLPDYVGQAAGGTWWVAENLGERFTNHYLDKLDTVNFASRVSSFATPTEFKTDEPTIEEPEQDARVPDIQTLYMDV